MPDPLHPLPPPVAPMTWRARVDALALRLGVEPARLLRWGLAGSVALVVGVVALVSWRSSTAPAELDLPRAKPAAAAPGAPGGVSTTATAATAHAAGAILRPGVYRLPPGARVTDLIDAAGGPTGDADLDQLNLAAPVADGERVYVPHRGEAPPPVSNGGGAAGAPMGPVDLNTATADQLDTLPGVGPATAQAILQYRSEHGRFRSVDDLLDVPGIGDAKLEHLRALVKV
ncbi:MAG: competence protein ComEA [Actinomycetota bacterium]|jgi:competence protein ComEA